MGLISKPIFSKLAKRFDIRQASAEQLESGQVLVPITNADEFLRIPKAQQTTGATTARTDTYTVPLGKNWYLVAMDITRANAGVNQFNGTVDGYSFSLAVGGSAVSAQYVPASPLKFKGGDSLQAQANSGTSGNIVSTIVYYEEDA